MYVCMYMYTIYVCHPVGGRAEALTGAMVQTTSLRFRFEGLYRCIYMYIHMYFHIYIYIYMCLYTPCTCVTI